MAIWEEILKGKADLPWLWRQLDMDSKVLATNSFYQHDFDDGGAQHMQADARVAAALKFRPQAVRQLPIERRAKSIAYSTRLTPELIAMILTGFHFEQRRELMACFLDALGIEHKGG